MKKGFTVMELLAVIVIIALVILITIPIVINLIENSKKNAALESAYGVKKSVDYYYMTDFKRNKLESFTCDFSNGCDEIDVNGTKPSSGIISLNKNGDIEFQNLIINGYAIYYDPVKEKFSL